MLCPVLCMCHVRTNRSAPPPASSHRNCAALRVVFPSDFGATEKFRGKASRGSLQSTRADEIAERDPEYRQHREC